MDHVVEKASALLSKASRTAINLARLEVGSAGEGERVAEVVGAGADEVEFVAMLVVVTGVQGCAMGM